MERWYLLITEKFLFWAFRWWEIRSFFQRKSWWKDDIYLVFLSFLWYSRFWELWFFVQCTSPLKCVDCHTFSSYVISGTVLLFFVLMSRKYHVSSLDYFWEKTSLRSYFVWAATHFCLIFYVDTPLVIPHFLIFGECLKFVGIDFCHLCRKTSLLLVLYKVTIFCISYRR